MGFVAIQVCYSSENSPFDPLRLNVWFEKMLARIFLGIPRIFFLEQLLCRFNAPGAAGNFCVGFAYSDDNVCLVAAGFKGAASGARQSSFNEH